MASNIQNHTQDGTTGDLLDRLCAEIETAWQERRDPSEVNRIAREHPDLAAELYDFFASLMETELDPDQDDEGSGPEPIVQEVARGGGLRTRPPRRASGVPGHGDIGHVDHRRRC